MRGDRPTSIPPADPPRHRPRRAVAVASALGALAAGAVVVAHAPTATALPCRQECGDARDGADHPHLPPVSPGAPPAPAAPLHRVYVGELDGDDATHASAVLHVDGDPSALTVTVDVASGVDAECHGRRSTGIMHVAMTGARTAVDPTGAATIHLASTVDTSYAGQSVTISFATDAALSADGGTLAGAVPVHVDLPWPIGDCDVTWRFQTSAR